MEVKRPQPSGMNGFLIVWFGQFVSMLGTRMTNFAVSLWMFEATGSASSLTTIVVFFMLPSILLSPFAGAIVDRGNRKMIMILSDLAAGIGTVILLALFITGNLSLWHIYAVSLISGAANAFQFPAYSAAVTLLLPKEHYARASGLISMANSASQILAPALAAVLLRPVGLEGIMLFDVASFLIAIFTLAIVFIPQPQKSNEESGRKNSFAQDAVFGFRYIAARPSLLGLQLFFTAMNFLAVFGLVLISPYILARTGSSEQALASVQSIGAIGGVAGGLLLGTWGGPKRKIYSLLSAMVGMSLLGEVLMGIGQVIFIWTLAAFAINFFLPIANGSSQAIWQSKIAPEIQGRVFSVRAFIAQSTAPIGAALAGLLADNLFEPAMDVGGSLTSTFGWLVGIGPGAGMGLMLVISGLLGALAVVVTYSIPTVRDVEQRLPDFDLRQPALGTEGRV